MQTLRSHFLRILPAHSRKCLFAVGLIVTSATSAHALAAHTDTISIDISIPCREQMPAFADQITLESPRTTIDVVDVGQRLKMVGINAVPHAARMVQLQAIGNGADNPFVSDNVRLLGSVSVVSSAISLRGYCPAPQPARTSLFDLRPKQRDMIFYSAATRLRNGRFNIQAVSIDAGAEAKIRTLATRVARPIPHAFGFAEGGKESGFAHQSVSSHDLQSFLGGNRFWRERVSARENLSPQLLYIGATA